MKLKFDIKQFAISLVISPVVFYLVVGIAKFFRESYQINQKKYFII